MYLNRNRRWINRSLKRTIALLAAAAVSALLMTACGSASGGEPAESGTGSEINTENTGAAEETGEDEAAAAPSQGSADETDEGAQANESVQTKENAQTGEDARADEGTPAGEGAQNEAPAEPSPIDKAKDTAVRALLTRMAKEREAVYVYKDFGVTENHFTQKAKMFGRDGSLVQDMDENWQEDPREGSSCIRCAIKTREGDWGGWLFLNGFLPEGESVPLLNDGSEDGQGLDLTGAKELRFWAKGEEGGERVEFFTAGFGYDGTSGRRIEDYPDSSQKQSTGWIELTDTWEEYSIPLEDADMQYIVCGFGYVMNDRMNGKADNVFYLDGIRFTGDIRAARTAPVMIRSYDTENQYIQNVAFSYDNALAAMALISEGRQAEAQQLADAFVYAVRNDRALTPEDRGANAWEDGAPAPRRVRNAYAAGDISPYPGWESGARLPGWYDNEERTWYEDRYQVGSNVGNTSYVALALMQYYNKYGGEEYLSTARSLMDWVIDSCTDGGDGFTGGFDGWEEGDPPTVYPFTYKSIEHNIDAFAAFTALSQATGESKYREAADSALRFIQSMYDEEDKLFMTGTGDDGVTPNRSVVVLDAQVWCAMALGEAFEPYADALGIVEKMKSEEGGYPFCLENKNGGWWAEGTAYTALMYRGLGEEEKYEEAMEALMSIQLDSGLFPAATVDDLSTGMDLFDGSPWLYSTDPHIAPTAWFIMAANHFNPYVIGQ